MTTILEGARGALQAWVLCALFGAGDKPDLLVGTSIGAANAAGLAMWGVHMEEVCSCSSYLGLLGW
jgi:predicted acylesterase/phospholipase RssA